MFSSLFSNSGFMPHGHCYLWQPSLVWTIVTADMLIGLSYLTISMILYSMVRKIRLPYHTLFLAFGMFILACGATHFMEVYTLWIPSYWASAAVKVLTALASLATAIYLIKLYPHVVEVAEAATEINKTRVRVEEFFYNRISTPPQVKQLLRRIFVLPILFAVVIMAVGVLQARHLRISEEATEKTTKILALANLLKSYAADTQNYFREFWESGNQGLKKGSQIVQGKFEESLEELESLVANDPDHAKQLAEVRLAFEQWQNFAQGNPQIRDWNSNTRDAVYSFLNRNAQYRESIGERLDELITYEQELRDQRLQDGRALETVVFLLVGFYSLLMGLVLAFQGRNAIHRLSNSFGLALASERHSREKSEEALAARDEFLSLASHELRTPLTALKLQLQLVERSARQEKELSPTVSRLNDTMGLALKQVDSLASLVDDLLDTSRIQSGKFNLNRSHENLAQVVEEVISKFSVSIQTAGCTIATELESGLVGYWDRRRLEQIVANLLSNAVKYAPGSGLRVQAYRQGECAVLAVEDSGPGIAKDVQPRIFERFERVHSGDGIGGLGLGLYIVKGIVESMGGSIHVESEVGQGARFIVEIPFSPADAAKVTNAQK